jgi:hypothetical protein
MFRRLSFPQSVDFFTKCHAQLSTLHETFLSGSINYLEELFHHLEAFTDQKPCSWVHLIYERSLITDSTVPGELVLFPAGPRQLPVQDFLRKGVIEVHPFVGRHFDSSEFSDFFHKYCLVVKELIFKSMRNKSRQRRSIPRYYEDFNILFNEANAYDNQVLTQAGLQPREGNTVALTLVINLVLTCSLELLNKGFELDLYALHEQTMVFSYLKYLYTLLVLNRKSMVLGMAGDEIIKKALINLENLNESPDMFKQKRKKFSPV